MTAIQNFAASADLQGLGAYLGIMRRSWSPWRGPVIATAKKNVKKSAH
jgi:hypothetical protein